MAPLMDERIAALSWVSMVDRVYGKVDQFFRELAVTDNEWRWSQVKFPEFFGRIAALEDQANPTLEKPVFWDLVDRWGQNHLFLFRQIKRARSEGIPEVSQEDVERAAAANRDRERESGQRPGGDTTRGDSKSNSRARSRAKSDATTTATSGRRQR